MTVSAILVRPAVVTAEVSLWAELDAVLERATENVRPSDWAIKFYDAVGRLPWHLGAALLILTSLDAIKVVILSGIMQRTDAALQVLYDYRFRPWRLLWAIGDHLWQQSFNCRSVRARGKFVRKAVRVLLTYLVQEKASQNGRGQQLVIVSIGSGSASQLLQGIRDNGFGAKEVRVVMIDHDPRALKAGVENAWRIGLEAAIEAQKTTIGKFLGKATRDSVDLVEMVGLADYFQDTTIQRYFAGIHKVIAPEGFFLGANISSREEMAYAHGAACWPAMHYRSKEELTALLGNAGFETIWTGDCGLYTVWVAQKSA